MDVREWWLEVIKLKVIHNKKHSTQNMKHCSKKADLNYTPSWEAQGSLKQCGMAHSGRECPAVIETIQSGERALKRKVEYMRQNV